MSINRSAYWNPELETLPWPAVEQWQAARIDKALPGIRERSDLYREKLGRLPGDLRLNDLATLQQLLFTQKDDVRAAQELATDNAPLGRNQAAPLVDIVQTLCSSGTTGKPLYYGLTRHDSDMFADAIANTWFTADLRPTDVVAHLVGLPMVAGGLAYADGFRRIGATLATTLFNLFLAAKTCGDRTDRSGERRHDGLARGCDRRDRVHDIRSPGLAHGALSVARSCSGGWHELRLRAHVAPHTLHRPYRRHDHLQGHERVSDCLARSDFSAVRRAGRTHAANLEGACRSGALRSPDCYRYRSVALGAACTMGRPGQTHRIGCSVPAAGQGERQCAQVWRIAQKRLQECPARGSGWHLRIRQWVTAVRLEG